MNINLEYYKVFYYVCQEGSLTAAAQRLCISQPAVSQAVRQLEKEAGTKLFSRTSKGVLLTREGELLYHYVKGGVEQLLEGGRMLKRMLDMDMGEVRIGASDMTLQFFFTSLSGAVPQRISEDQGDSDQCADSGDHPLPGRGQDRLRCGNNAIFRSWSYPQYRGKAD